jgi:hypothetical protein
MDIFTTQLTRVVPVPIKPTSLKVKALLKDAANAKLKEDHDHLENHEYYFEKEEDQYHANHQENSEKDKDEQQLSETKNSMPPAQKDGTTDRKGEQENSTKNIIDKDNHLDLYV